VGGFAATGNGDDDTLVASLLPRTIVFLTNAHLHETVMKTTEAIVVGGGGGSGMVIIVKAGIAVPAESTVSD